MEELIVEALTRRSGQEALARDELYGRSFKRKLSARSCLGEVV